MGNFTYYGRFNKKKIKSIGDPGKRSGFKINNKIFFSHFKEK